MVEATPPPLPELTLAVGDRVVYPNQGVCRVTSVAAKEVAGQTLTFVTMRREEDGAVVMVPQTKVRSIGLRKVADKNEVTALFDFLKSESDKATLDWKQRARTNQDRMSVGGLLGLGEVVKGLQVLSELRPLPNKERELYDNARHLLVAELSASLDISECDAEDAIDVVLFPPGRERPKRTVEEFRQRPEDDEEALDDLGDDLLGLGGDLELPADAELPGADGEGEVAKPAAVEVPVKRKRGRPPKPKPLEVAPPVPKKRGRPPKPKPALPPLPKKRGRPPKPKPPEKAVAKKAAPKSKAPVGRPKKKK